ncbi:RNase adaptor protein RapZ [Alkalilimnicola ehrlichii]|uniref:RNase adaptor protein RapZ n=1 Tax=Alkalilimnicola ehrlichii TaxID=351052 RepID=A0A3E0WY00_9GAMM|nr:RNase adapter RapZ [Alkalilimnicola ehrlichii]RFA30283.1 RNase adaptor protein RapZ [Alkalilimnicola ehrlichii]RFA37862.1 RNase adaptor protein RapZ [Alkalilimnicola ehrlichii]
MKLVIISGLSGSGKSVALHTLEDVGFYCIDNLPVELLDAFGRHLIENPYPQQERYAVSIDARNNPGALSRFPDILEQLAERGLRAEILFLRADNDTLIKRFSETRRRHPLSNGKTSLAEAIEREQELLSPILGRADLVIDSTQTTLHQLRNLVRERLDRRHDSRISLLFQSFGFKHGIPKDADFVFDVRCLPNPHWEPRLRPLCGRDAEVCEYLESTEEVGRMLGQIQRFVDDWLPSFERENRSYLTVAIGCTGGQHRSVYLVERLAEHFRKTRDDVAIRHRELS